MADVEVDAQQMNHILPMLEINETPQSYEFTSRIRGRKVHIYGENLFYWSDEEDGDYIAAAALEIFITEGVETIWLKTIDATPINIIAVVAG